MLFILKKALVDLQFIYSNRQVVKIENEIFNIWRDYVTASGTWT